MCDEAKNLEVEIVITLNTPELILLLHAVPSARQLAVGYSHGILPGAAACATGAALQTSSCYTTHRAGWSWTRGIRVDPDRKQLGLQGLTSWTPQIMGGVPNRHQNSIIFDHSWSYLVQGPVILNTNHTFGTSFEDFEKGEWRARRGWMIPSPDPLTQVCYKHQLAIQSSLHVLMHRHWSSNRRASLYKEVGFDHHLSLFWRHRFLESWEILTIRNLTKIYRN